MLLSAQHYNSWKRRGICQRSCSPAPLQPLLPLQLLGPLTVVLFSVPLCALCVCVVCASPAAEVLVLDGPVRESSPQPTFTTLPPTPPPSVLSEDEKQRISSSCSDPSAASFSPQSQASSLSTSSFASYRPSSAQSSSLLLPSQPIAVSRFPYGSPSPHSPPSYLLHPRGSHCKADSTDSAASSSSFVPPLLPSPTEPGLGGSGAWSCELGRLVSEPITKNELQLRAAEAVTAALHSHTHTHTHSHAQPPPRKSPSPSLPQRSPSPFPLTSPHSPTPSMFIGHSPPSTGSSAFHHYTSSLHSLPFPLLPSPPSASSPLLHQPKPRVAQQSTPLDGLEDDAVTFLSFLASSPQPEEPAREEEARQREEDDGQRREEKRRALAEQPQALPSSSSSSDRRSSLLCAVDAKRVSEDAHRLHLAATAAVIVDRPRPVPARIAIPLQHPQQVSAAATIARYATAVRPVTAPSAGSSGAMHGNGAAASMGAGDGVESGGGMSPMSVGSLNSSFSSPMSSPLSFGHMLVGSPPPPASLASATFSSAASVASTSSTASIASAAVHPTGLLASSRVLHPTPPPAAAASASVSSSSSSSHRFACSECPKSFPSNSALSMHLLVHSGSKPFPCPSCPRRFRQKGHLQSHVRKHTGEKPYECTACGKAFKDKSGLNTHGKRVHGLGPTPHSSRRRGREHTSNSSSNRSSITLPSPHTAHADAAAQLYAAGEGMSMVLEGEMRMSGEEGRCAGAGMGEAGGPSGTGGEVMMMDAGIGEVKTGLDSLFLVPPLPSMRAS